MEGKNCSEASSGPSWCEYRKWREEQLYLKNKVKIWDIEPWQKEKLIYNPKLDERLCQTGDCLRYVAGFDVSFVKDSELAVSGLIVCDMGTNMKIVYQDVDKNFINMDVPYRRGYLAYREAPFLLKKLDVLKQKRKDLYPQCIFVDGNGVLHERRFGFACHVGYYTGIPTIGCTKKFHNIRGLQFDEEHIRKFNMLTSKGDYYELNIERDDEEPELLGYCYKSLKSSENPLYISVGSNISWDTCLWVTKEVIRKSWIPEPIRIADLITRERVKRILEEKGPNLTK